MNRGMQHESFTVSDTNYVNNEAQYGFLNELFIILSCSKQLLQSQLRSSGNVLIDLSEWELLYVLCS